MSGYEKEFPPSTSVEQHQEFKSQLESSGGRVMESSLFWKDGQEEWVLWWDNCPKIKQFFDEHCSLRDKFLIWAWDSMPDNLKLQMPPDVLWKVETYNTLREDNFVRWGMWGYEKQIIGDRKDAWHRYVYSYPFEIDENQISGYE